MKTKIELANVMAEINIKIGEWIEDSNARKGGDIYKHTDAFKAINQALQNYNEYIGGADYTGKVSNEIINNIFKKYEPSFEAIEAARAFIINNVEPDTHEPAAAAPAPAPAPMKGFSQEEIERAIAESLKIPNALYAPPEPAPAPMKGFSQEEIERAIAESFESLNALPAFPRVGAAAAAGHYNAGSDQSKSYVSSSDAHRFDFNSRDTSAVSEVQSGLNKLYNTYKSKLSNYGSIVKYDEEKNEIARYVLQHLNELKSNSLMLGDELLSIPGLFYTNEV